MIVDNKFPVDKLTTLFAIFVLTSLAMFAAETPGTVNFSEPSDGATVSTPFHLLASGSSLDSVNGITVYVNGIKTASSTGSVLDASLSAVSGKTRVTVQAFNERGYFQKTIYVNVAASTSGGWDHGGTEPLPAAAKAFQDVERLPGWESCTVCAGPGGNGDIAQYSMRQHSLSPSLNGQAAKFDLGGARSYADALWWKQLGPDNSAHYFVYDLYFFIDKPEAAQALEFDVNQSFGGNKYIFGTECSLGRGTWDVWAADRSWIQTSVPCGKPTANAWHHLVWEFERTANDKVKYVAVTLDGVKHYVNQVYDPKKSRAREINVAFQMDGNRKQSSYSVSLNKVNLSYW